jgi:hypothetical protein
VFFYLSLELSWCRVSFLKGDLQFSKFLKNTICIGLCKLKCTEKRFIPFSLLHFLPEFVPHTEFKGRPEDTKWNVLYHTALKNYAAISLQVPAILSILLGYRGVTVLRSGWIFGNSLDCALQSPLDYLEVAWIVLYKVFHLQ